MLLELYRQGRLKLDELISSRYTLETLNQGFDDTRNGLNLRGIVSYPD